MRSSKDLYASAFSFKKSTTGLIKRPKLSAFSVKHIKCPSATTVAAFGIFRYNATVPKYEPRVNLATSDRTPSDGLFRYTIAQPKTTLYKKNKNKIFFYLDQ